MEDQRLSQLIDAWLDATLTPADKAELEQTLLTSASARRQFWQQASLHGLVHEAAKLAWAGEPSPGRPATRSRLAGAKLAGVFSRFFPPRHGWAAATLALGAIVVAAVFVQRTRVAPTPSSAAMEEQMTFGVAVLTRAVGVEWVDAAEAGVTGAVLEPGWLKLKAGLVQIEFFNGARVLLEGPAEFQLISSAEAFCRTGKVSAEVPPQARGFRIGSPQMTVIDLGTAFGLDVKSTGSEVHVFSGEVELLPQGQVDKRGLKEGEGLAVGIGGQVQTINANETAFASTVDVERRSSELLHRRLEAWRAVKARSNADPALLLHFDFENPAEWSRALRNQATQTGAQMDGVIVGGRWAEGRWPGKEALEFKNVSDRVRVSVDREFASLTLAAWLRLDSLERHQQALLNCDGYETGEFHWQINGNASLSVKAAGDPHATNGVVYRSPVFVTPEKLGQWMHLAVVHDAKAQTVTFYANGEAIGEEPITVRVPLRVETIELGNWNAATHAVVGAPIRNFNGRMDEFWMFARALDAAEIRQLHVDGRVQPDRTDVAAR